MSSVLAVASLASPIPSVVVGTTGTVSTNRLCQLTDEETSAVAWTLLSDFAVLCNSMCNNDDNWTYFVDLNGVPVLCYALHALHAFIPSARLDPARSTSSDTVVTPSVAADDAKHTLLPVAACVVDAVLALAFGVSLPADAYTRSWWGPGPKTASARSRGSARSSVASEARGDGSSAVRHHSADAAVSGRSGHGGSHEHGSGQGGSGHGQGGSGHGQGGSGHGGGSGVVDGGSVGVSGGGDSVRHHSEPHGTTASTPASVVGGGGVFGAPATPARVSVKCGTLVSLAVALVSMWVDVLGPTYCHDVLTWLVGLCGGVSASAAAAVSSTAGPEDSSASSAPIVSTWEVTILGFVVGVFAIFLPLQEVLLHFDLLTGDGCFCPLEFGVLFRLQRRDSSSHKLDCDCACRSFTSQAAGSSPSVAAAVTGADPREIAAALAHSGFVGTLLQFYGQPIPSALMEQYAATATANKSSTQHQHPSQSQPVATAPKSGGASPIVSDARTRGKAHGPFTGPAAVAQQSLPPLPVHYALSSLPSHSLGTCSCVRWPCSVCVCLRGGT